MKKTFVCKDAYNDMAGGVMDALRNYNQGYIPDDLIALLKTYKYEGKVKITFEYEVEEPQPSLGDNYRITDAAKNGSLNLSQVYERTPCRNGVFVGGDKAYPRVAFYVFADEIKGNGQIVQSGPTGLVHDPEQPKAQAKVGQKVRSIITNGSGLWCLVEGRIYEGRKIIVDRTDNPTLYKVGQVVDLEGRPMVGVPDTI